MFFLLLPIILCVLTFFVPLRAGIVLVVINLLLPDRLPVVDEAIQSITIIGKVLRTTTFIRRFKNRKLHSSQELSKMLRFYFLKLPLISVIFCLLFLLLILLFMLVEYAPLLFTG